MTGLSLAPWSLHAAVSPFLPSLATGSTMFQARGEGGLQAPPPCPEIAEGKDTGDFLVRLTQPSSYRLFSC